MKLKFVTAMFAARHDQRACSREHGTGENRPFCDGSHNKLKDPL
jgi:CDGSH-type Zn-finger protein